MTAFCLNFLFRDCSHCLETCLEKFQLLVSPLVLSLFSKFYQKPQWNDFYKIIDNWDNKYVNDYKTWHGTLLNRILHVLDACNVIFNITFSTILTYVQGNVCINVQQVIMVLHEAWNMTVLLLNWLVWRTIELRNVTSSKLLF